METAARSSAPAPAGKPAKPAPTAPAVHPPKTLPAMPDGAKGLARAATTVTRKPASLAVPGLEYRVKGVDLDPARMARYADVVGESGADVPLLWPQVVATPLAMALMNDPAFPFPLLGIVHLRNDVRRTAALDPQAKYDVTVKTGKTAVTPRGVEFELVMQFAPAGAAAPVYTGTMTVLYRAKTKASEAWRNKEVPPAELSAYLPIAAPADQGRRYAAVSGDYNPIHLYPLTAKALGFKQAIAHGMWSAARVLAEARKGLQKAPSAYEVAFLNPLFLPGRAAMKWAVDEERSGEGAEAETLRVELIGQRDAKVLLKGTIS